MSRPAMQFVAVKSAEQQAALMLIGVRARLVEKRMQIANAIRSPLYRPAPPMRRALRKVSGGMAPLPVRAATT